MKRIYIFIIIMIIGASFVACDKNEYINASKKSSVFSDIQQEKRGDNSEENTTEDSQPMTEQAKESSIKTNHDVKSQESSDVNQEESVFLFKTNNLHPIVIAYEPDGESISSAFVLGGSMDGKWFNITDFSVALNGNTMNIDEYTNYQYSCETAEPQNVEIDLLKKGDTFRFYSDIEYVSEQKVEQSLFYISELSGDAILEAVFEPFSPANTKNNSYLIGVNGEWNALPRPLKQLEKNKYSIDIDNDGEEEILNIVETPNNDEEGFINLRDIKLLLEKDGEEILVETSFLDGEYTENFFIYALDLNGDEILEILTFTTGNNVSIQAKQINGNVVNSVLSFYMGD